MYLQNKARARSSYLILVMASAIALVGSFVVSCTSATKSESAAAPASLCEQISQIKQLPFKGEAINDEAYNSLIRAGDKALPCLIESVSDSTPMRDPRQAPSFPGFAVGDVAYFVFIDITKLNFVELFPSALKEAYKTEGVYAYFRFVENKANREQLKQTMLNWYREKYEKH